MGRLAIILAGVLLIAVAIIELIPNFNWQTALILIAIGVALIIFFFKGQSAG